MQKASPSTAKTPYVTGKIIFNSNIRIFLKNNAQDHGKGVF
jgi:hypothetical protein